jgi:competence protein ComEC
MSFASVIAIVALHDSAPMRAFLAVREEAGWQRFARKGAMLLLTGVVVEVALMPIAIYHFHRAGFYGALANIIAIPLTEMVTMPAIGLGFVLDALGWGAPAWWITAKSLSGLLAIAHYVAAFPGSVTRLPAMGQQAFFLFVAGGLWLALWHGRIRIFGLVPVILGAVWLFTLRPPDLLIAGDGAHVGITGLVRDELVILREPRSDYARERLAEMAGMDGSVMPLRNWPQARCSPAFCRLDIERGGRTWRLLLALGRQPVARDDLTKACAISDIVVADRWLPSSCRPRALKADRAKLNRTGGMAIDLGKGRVETVAQEQGDHPWWQSTQRVTQPYWRDDPRHQPWAAPSAAY